MISYSLPSSYLYQQYRQSTGEGRFGLSDSTPPSPDCVLIARIVAYDVKSSMLLLAAIATEATGPLAIVLVNCSTPLLGQTPAIKPQQQDDGYHRPPYSSKTSRERQPLSLERGEFVTVVGWLECDQSKLSSQVSLLTRNPRKGHS